MYHIQFHVLELQNATSPIKDKTALDATLKMLLTMSASQSEENDSQSQKSTDARVTDNSLKISTMKNRISALEKELQESKETLSVNAEYIKNLEVQNKSLTQTNENLCKRVEELEASLKDVNNVLAKTRKDVEEANELNSTYKEEKVILENKISNLLKQCDTLTSASFTSTKENDSKNKEIKHVMNQIYHSLLDKFVDESYPTVYIKSTIASTIKNVTLQILYNVSKESNKETKSVSDKIIETDTSKTADTELEKSDPSNSTIQLPKQTEVLESVNISPVLLQDEPPPIPPIDTEDNSDWLH